MSSEMQARIVEWDFSGQGGMAPSAGNNRVLRHQFDFSPAIGTSAGIPNLILGIYKLEAEPGGPAQIYEENLTSTGFRVVVEAGTKIYRVKANYLAYPDPNGVRITSGSLWAKSNRGPKFNFRGEGFEISNNGGDTGSVSADMSPYKPGAAISLYSLFAGEQTLGSGNAQVGDYSGKLYYTGQIIFTGEPLQVPGSSPGTSTVTGPFSMRGQMQGYKQNPFPSFPGEPVFNKRLAGQGNATVTLSYSADFFSFKSLQYNFQA